MNVYYRKSDGSLGKFHVEDDYYAGAMAEVALHLHGEGATENEINSVLVVIDGGKQ